MDVETKDVPDRGGGDVGSAPAVAPAKKRGRRPGTPKTGGRAPGSPNKKTTVSRDYIVKRSDALPFLCAVAAGRKVKVADPVNPTKKIELYPAFEQRLRAAEILARKIVPDVKAVEIGGSSDGEPLTIRILSFANADA